MTDRMEEFGGLLWWKRQHEPVQPQRPISVEDVATLMRDLYQRHPTGPGTTIYMDIKTAETFSKLVSTYRRRANRRRRKQQKRAIGRHRW